MITKEFKKTVYEQTKANVWYDKQFKTWKASWIGKSHFHSISFHQSRAVDDIISHIKMYQNDICPSCGNKHIDGTMNNCV